jgi:hypothetical protein
MAGRWYGFSAIVVGRLPRRAQREVSVSAVFAVVASAVGADRVGMGVDVIDVR